MSSTSSILANLRHRTFSSQAHQRLADLILSRMEEVSTWGIQKLADEAATSVAAVVRFAKGLGCDGFSDLRNRILTETRVRDLGEDRLMHAPKEASATMMEIARRDFANIEHAVQLLDEPLRHAIAARLQQADHRVLIGHGISWVMAQHLAYLLTHCGLITVAGSPAEFGRQAVNLSHRDVLVVFSFPPYSRETLQVVHYVKERKVPVIAFTDGPRSPFAQVADLVVTVPGENLFYSHSLAAFSVIGHAIAMAITQQDPEAALYRLHEAERIAEGLLV